MSPDTNTEKKTGPEFLRRCGPKILPVQINDAQKLESAIRKARLEDEVDENEKTHKQVVKKYNEEREANLEQLKILRAEVKKAERLAPVDIFEQYWRGMVEVVRADTNEVIDRRSPNPSELQRSLPKSVLGEMEPSELLEEAAQSQRASEDDDGDLDDVTDDELDLLEDEPDEKSEPPAPEDEGSQEDYDEAFEARAAEKEQAKEAEKSVGNKRGKKAAAAPKKSGGSKKKRK